MRILITGANGFVGRHLIHRLQAAESAHAIQIFAATHSGAENNAHIDEEGRLEQVPLDILDAGATQILRPRECPPTTTNRPPDAREL